jgi:hypothetical protein
MRTGRWSGTCVRYNHRKLTSIAATRSVSDASKMLLGSEVKICQEYGNAKAVFCSSRYSARKNRSWPCERGPAMNIRNLKTLETTF